MGTGSIVRGDAGFVKSPTWADGRPLTKTLLGAMIVLARGGQKVSLQTGKPGAGVNTSPALALGRPFEKTVDTIGVTTFCGYTQQGLKEIESGFPKAAIGLVMLRFCFEFLLASIETSNYFSDNYDLQMYCPEMEQEYFQISKLHQIH